MAKKYLQLGNIIKRLLFERDMKAVDLAREVNIPPPTIHRLITGKSTRPYKSSLKPIADYFAVSIDELLGERPLSENQTQLIEDNNRLISSKVSYLPIIPWGNISTEIQNNKKKFEQIPFVGAISKKGYATILEDSSMEPLFPNKSLLIFDPEKLFKDRSFILAQLQETNTPVFRQLLIDLNQKYLKPLNPDLNAFKMRLLGKQDNIIATLVESRQMY